MPGGPASQGLTGPAGRSFRPEPPRPAPRLVSVIIPVRNAAKTLGETLGGLARQDYRGQWEVIVADNGSSDRPGEVVSEWYGRLPGLRLVHADGGPVRPMPGTRPWPSPRAISSPAATATTSPMRRGWALSSGSPGMQTASVDAATW